MSVSQYPTRLLMTMSIPAFRNLWAMLEIADGLTLKYSASSCFVLSAQRCLNERRSFTVHIFCG